MTWWKVSTLEKKNVFEHELYQKDDWLIRRITCFRWGTVLIETEDINPPVLDQTDGPGADAVNMYGTEYTYDLDMLSDGCSEDYIWPDDMPEEERDRLLELVNELGVYEALEDEEGYELYDTECWFHGPLKIERVDDEEWQEPAEHEWIKAEITPELQDHFQRALGNFEDDRKTIQLPPAWPFPTGNTNKGE